MSLLNCGSGPLLEYLLALLVQSAGFEFCVQLCSLLFPLLLVLQHQVVRFLHCRLGSLSDLRLLSDAYDGTMTLSLKLCTAAFVRSTAIALWILDPVFGSLRVDLLFFGFFRCILLML